MQRNDPYWTTDSFVGAVDLRDGPAQVHMKQHRYEEHYPANHRELTAITPAPGIRDYIHVRPYVLIPDITVVVGLYPQPTQEGAIGAVLDAQTQGMRQQDIADGQAWYYRADHLLMIWELDIFRPFLTATPPAHNAAMLALWRHFEADLLRAFPETQRIVTPAWEPDYPAEWQPFLLALGYAPHPTETAIFVKEHPTPPAAALAYPTTVSPAESLAADQQLIERGATFLDDLAARSRIAIGHADRLDLLGDAGALVYISRAVLHQAQRAPDDAKTAARLATSLTTFGEALGRLRLAVEAAERAQQPQP